MKDIISFNFIFLTSEFDKNRYPKVTSTFQFFTSNFPTTSKSFLPLVEMLKVNETEELF